MLRLASLLSAPDTLTDRPLTYHAVLCHGAGSPLAELTKGQRFSFDAPSYSLSFRDQGPFASPLLRVRYSSLTQPDSTFDIHMGTGGCCWAVG